MSLLVINSPTNAAPLSSSAVTEIIRAKLEARKPPPPEPISVIPPADLNGDPRTNTGEPSTGAPLSASSPPPSRQEKFVPPNLYAGRQLLRTATMLTRFYEGRSYQPAWITPEGSAHFGEQFIQLLQEEAGREGLRASDYHLAKLQAFLAEARLKHEAQHVLAPEFLADLDLLLTDAFLLYGAAVSIGEVRLDSLDVEWFVKKKKKDLVLALQNAITTNQLPFVFRELPPKHTGYIKLRNALAYSRDIAAHGGWPTIPAGPALGLGDYGERVAALRTRITASLNLNQDRFGKGTRFVSMQKEKTISTVHDHIFDEHLEQNVKRFQKQHGLRETGIVNTETLAALNVPIETRIQQIIVNMRRWRQLPDHLGQRHIMVNIPDFMLEVVEQEQAVMTMKVVVGKVMDERSTPSFSAEMKYLVLNPYWYVPKTIAQKELLPLAKKNPNYLARNNYTMHRIPSGQKQIPDPNATDGSMLSVKTYDYVLRQRPGPKNALGRVKFMFPNPYNVYLHDTPSKNLFNREVRAFSHGCIRVEKPLDLAEYLLSSDPKWDNKAILSTLKRQKERTVWLQEPLPVHIQYWTAWVDQNDTIQFRPDIYKRDKIGKAVRSRGKSSTSSRQKRSKNRRRPSDVQPTTNPSAPVSIQAAN